MKIIYIINKVLLIATIVLYATLYLGLYAQVVLGVIQIISAFLLLFFWNDLQKEHKKMLLLYYTLVVIYGVACLINWNVDNEMLIFLFGLILIPMGMAVYFTILLHKIAKQLKTQKK